jgi:hypothetical protein
MSTYQGIRGLKVRDYTTNPDDPLEGQLWYNKTDQVGKYQIPNITAAWRTQNNMNTAREKLAGAGLSTAALAIGGEVPSTIYGNTESWNGSAWTELNDLNTARSQSAAGGTYTSSLIFGGRTPSNTGITESWNGSS